MRPLKIAVLPLALVLLAVPSNFTAALEARSEVAQAASFVPSSGWRVKGYQPFVGSEQATGSLPACEARKGIPAGTPARFFTADRRKGPLAMHASQYILQFADRGDAVQLADKLASNVRLRCANAQKRDSGNVQFVHRYHVKPAVQIANGGAEEIDTLAVWSTSYRRNLVEVFNAGDNSRSQNETAFGDLTVVAVGLTGNKVTVLMFALEESVDPPWKALRKTARTAMRLLSPDPWQA